MKTALPQVTHIAQQIGLDLNQAIVSLDGVYDSRANRKAIFNRGMVPNIRANPRGRNTLKRGRRPIFDPAIFQERCRTIERGVIAQLGVDNRREIARVKGMKELPDLKQLTDSDKDALIQKLWDELQKRREKKPKKTSKNSSLPPAQGFKAAVSEPSSTQEMKRSASLGRAGGGRQLSHQPPAKPEAWGWSRSKRLVPTTHL